MNNLIKKHITFFIYMVFILAPTLYWIRLSWGISVLFSLKTFINLISNDLSFLLTVLSVFGAMIIGFFSIVIKEKLSYTDHDIYDNDEFISESVSNNIVDNSLSNSQLDVDNLVTPPPPASVFNLSKLHENKTDINDIYPEINIEREPIISLNYDNEGSYGIDPNYFDNILKSKGYRTFDVKIIEGFNVLFFAVSNKNILFGYNMPFVGEIIANELMPEDSTLNHPLWFSHMHRFMSPIFAVTEIRSAIDNLLSSVLPKDHDITIESYCILDDKAVILNLDNAQEDWNKNAVNVAMQSKEYKTIPAFASLLDDNSTNEILPSFLEFAKTLEQYFIQKARISALKKN